MKICVYGLWHLGSVTAACLAESFSVIGCDPDGRIIRQLRRARPTVSEPGLPGMLRAGLSSGKLSFTTDVAAALKDADVVWVTFDTPIDEDDVPDIDFVAEKVRSLFPHLTDGTLVLISSQAQVGFTAKMEAAYCSAYPRRKCAFAYSPENLQLGKALHAFCHPARVVIGVRHETERRQLSALFAPFCKRIEWMSVESAEMTKHALNAFLAASVTFINEIAVLCEKVGADAREVERALKSDPRIGPHAYLRPGSAWAGGTLGRDVRALCNVGRQTRQSLRFLHGVWNSNQTHKLWIHDRLDGLLGRLRGKTVVILGLAYKPNTDTLRRSNSVELGLWLRQQGASVRAYDPAIRRLPRDLQESMDLCPTIKEAMEKADALVVATGCPEFENLTATDVLAAMRVPNVVDPNRFLEAQLASDNRICYIAVGKPKVKS